MAHVESVNLARVRVNPDPKARGKSTGIDKVPTAGTLVLEGRSLAGQRPHRFAARGLARTFQTPRVFADMPVLTNIEFGLKFAGRRPRKYWLWGDEQGVPWALRDAPGILTLIGLSGQAALPASALTPSAK